MSDKQKALEKPIRNRCRRSCDRGFFEQKLLKNRMFVGTSISEAFWEDFGKVLGGQNPRFSHFFRCFFEVNFEVRFGRAKNRPKRPNKAEVAKIWTWIPVVPRLLGRDYREGYSKSRTFLCYFIFRFENLKTLRPACRCHTFGGRRIETPQRGATAAHPLHEISARRCEIRFGVRTVWVGW